VELVVCEIDIMMKCNSVFPDNLKESRKFRCVVCVGVRPAQGGGGTWIPNQG